MKEQLLKQVRVVQEALWLLEDMISDNDTEKQRISMLLWGRPDFHLTNPDGFQRLCDWGRDENGWPVLADESKPPFSNELIWMLMHTGKDPRLTYEQIEKLKNGGDGSSGTQPWDDLVKSTG